MGQGQGQGQNKVGSASVSGVKTVSGPTQTVGVKSTAISGGKVVPVAVAVGLRYDVTVNICFL